MSSSDLSEHSKIILNSLFFSIKRMFKKIKGSSFAFDCGDKVFSVARR